MSELTKGFEKYFPLPWGISFYGDGVHYIDSKNGSGFWIMEDREGDATKKQDTAEGRAAMEYMAKCANLMPEVIKVLKQAQDGIKEACNYHCYYTCPSCDWCEAQLAEEQIGALLAKLEGDAETK
ncbi:hypothetical protein [Cloacibacillus sp. An23]|uniref:hypothetical protein n=1 Tax=Cloacibacillus sp. An23 TaxID=1965591 RepID=UPI000B37C159|nr:hypothetical protein [Cloacibacillus sp. An23]OUO94777.1 hypothetical protein B5F39_02600 [Cloacibacillus sp. An23]